MNVSIVNIKITKHITGINAPNYIKYTLPPTWGSKHMIFPQLPGIKIHRMNIYI